MHALYVERLEFLLQLRRKAQIREVPPQLRRVGRIRKVIEVEREGGQLH